MWTFRRGAAHFNSRPSARGDGGKPCTTSSFTRFQFTPLREGRRNGYACRVVMGIFQFTPLREGRPIQQHAGRAGVCISIHAPPRGATGSVMDGYVLTSISIHAPPRGATRQEAASAPEAPFQFTPLREGRLGAAKPSALVAVFQFTPLREGRRATGFVRLKPSIFQFTPLREGRHATYHWSPASF